MNKISVVILNWNGCEMLRSFLPSVLRYSEAEGVEVCVADNGSMDQSVEMLRREFPSVRRILLDGNHGFADGYNLALRQVEAEYVVLLNSDVETPRGWLEPILGVLERLPIWTPILRWLPASRRYAVGDKKNGSNMPELPADSSTATDIRFVGEG